MVAAAQLHARIYQSYNLPYDPAPGSIMDKAAKLWRKKEARKCVERRLFVGLLSLLWVFLLCSVAGAPVIAVSIPSCCCCCSLPTNQPLD